MYIIFIIYIALIIFNATIVYLILFIYIYNYTLNLYYYYSLWVHYDKIIRFRNQSTMYYVTTYIIVISSFPRFYASL